MQTHKVRHSRGMLDLSNQEQLEVQKWVGLAAERPTLNFEMDYTHFHRL